MTKTTVLNSFPFEVLQVWYGMVWYGMVWGQHGQFPVRGVAGESRSSVYASC